MKNLSEFDFTEDPNDRQDTQCPYKITSASPCFIYKVSTVIGQRLKRNLHAHFGHGTCAIPPINSKTIRVRPIKWFLVPFNKGERKVKSDVTDAFLYTE